MSAWWWQEFVACGVFEFGLIARTVAGWMCQRQVQTPSCHAALGLGL